MGIVAPADKFLSVQGMGEGEGAKDVSDQIENEDQLLGAKQKDAAEEKVGHFQLLFFMGWEQTSRGRLSQLATAKQRHALCL